MSSGKSGHCVGELGRCSVGRVSTAGAIFGGERETGEQDIIAVH